jgi:hypothetical protein
MNSMTAINPMNGQKKSSICRYYALDGICFYGTDCQFLHSNNDSNNPLSHLPQESRLQTYLHQNNGTNPLNNSYYGNDPSISSQMNALTIDSQQNRRKLNPNMTNTSTNQSINCINTQTTQPLIPNYFTNDSIKQELIRKLSLTLEMPSNDLFVNLPQVDIYHDLIPLESSQSSPSSTFNGMVSTVFRATNTKNGQLYRFLYSY